RSCWFSGRLLGRRAPRGAVCGRLPREARAKSAEAADRLAAGPRRLPADDTVAASELRLVEARIGGREQRLEVGAVFGARRHADARRARQVRAGGGGGRGA